MNWFDLLKNQIASTKGKTFQLDFSQPMVEEDDSCKKRLSAFFELLKDVNRIEPMGFWADITIHMHNDFMETIPEDVACNIINELLNLEKPILQGKKRTELESIGLKGKEFVNHYTYNYRGLYAYYSFVYDIRYMRQGQDNLFIKYEYENGGVKTGMEIDLYGIWDEKPHIDVFKFIKENL